MRVAATLNLILMSCEMRPAELIWITASYLNASIPLYPSEHTHHNIVPSNSDLLEERALE